jgi:CPA2 family monovalent cation:H+ antiporter-2
VFVAGCGGLFLLVLLLSSTILPSWNVLVVLGLVLAGATVLLRRAFIRLYSKAQGALSDTFAQPPPARHVEPVGSLPSLLHEAQLKTVSLAGHSTFVGCIIAEVGLRTRTGASVVGIERAGGNIINPGPGEELQSGDQLLIIGSTDQLAAAEKLFAQPGSTVSIG